ncbi:hypothetical protein L490_5151 [Bordetella bronchiseptica 00-P-2796]|uniref:Uncharacterized protein n=1 Tax=Bordetella bronchiseptica 00-P-2796 TaxID=1331199 RepID=A0ABR4RJ50_BORBO|nr:hypothetical protein L490_5151 [Bordetella bronchiseptica 00-P-2796]
MAHNAMKCVLRIVGVVQDPFRENHIECVKWHVEICHISMLKRA